MVARIIRVWLITTYAAGLSAHWSAMLTKQTRSSVMNCGLYERSAGGARLWKNTVLSGPRSTGILANFFDKLTYGPKSAAG